jgi:hypothetical protein
MLILDYLSELPAPSRVLIEMGISGDGIRAHTCGCRKCLIDPIGYLGAFPSNLNCSPKCLTTKIKKSDAYVSLLLALVAGFALVVGRPSGLNNLLTFDDCTCWGHAVPA